MRFHSPGARGSVSGTNRDRQCLLAACTLAQEPYKDASSSLPCTRDRAATSLHQRA